MSAREIINLPKHGAVAGCSSGNGVVTREMVHARAAELVFLDGRLACEATMADFAQAKRELTGEASIYTA